MRVRKGLGAVLAALLAVVLCGTASVAAYAHEAVDMSQTGSFKVTMEESDGDAVPGGTLRVYRVADVQQVDGDYSFALTDEFAGSGVALDDIEAAGVAEALAAYATENGIAGTDYAIDTTGTATGAGMELGLYLITEPEPAEGYEAVSPFLVSLPLYDEATDHYVYQVDASPKVETVSHVTHVPEEPGEPTEPETPVTPATPEEPAQVVEETPEPDTTAVTETKLPQTGTLEWLVPVMAVGGIVAFMGGWALVNDKRGEACAA